MKKWILSLLCCALVLPLLVACSNNENSQDDSTSGETEAPEQTVQPLAVESLSDYVIVYPDEGMNVNLLAEVRNVQAALKDKFGVRPNSKSDFVTEKNPVQTREILIGQTNREESAAVYAEAPRADDYAIRICGEKVVITAWTEEKLILAMQTFAQSISALDADCAYFFNDSMQVLVKGEYALENITLNGNNISEYAIVYEESVKGLAEMVREEIQTYSGYVLSLCEDSDAESDDKKILVGNTAFDLPADLTNAENTDQYYVGMSGSDLYLYGVDAPAVYRAVKAFSDSIAAAEGPVAMLDPNAGVVLSADTSLTAMSFNVLVNYYTAERAAHVVDMIRKYMPDTLGVQEASDTWVATLKLALSDAYEYVGGGRDGSSGEQCGIFYKKDVFTLIEGGVKWLTDTPDVVSKVDGSIYNRIFTYVILERKSDNTRMMHINVHPDHTELDSVRLEQMKALMNFVAKYPKLPILLTGDFNNEATASPIQHILSNGMENSSVVAFDGDTNYTFKQKVIDFIFVSEDDFVVYDYMVDTTKYGDKDPSDHCPILIQYDLK